MFITKSHLLPKLLVLSKVLSVSLCQQTNHTVMTIFQVSGYLYITFTLQAMQHWTCCHLGWLQIVSCGEISYQSVPGRQMVPSPLNVNLKQNASTYAFLQTKHCGRASAGVLTTFTN